jgi:hypothetical protein
LAAGRLQRPFLWVFYLAFGERHSNGKGESLLVFVST